MIGPLVIRKHQRVTGESTNSVFGYNKIGFLLYPVMQTLERYLIIFFVTKSEKVF